MIKKIVLSVAVISSLFSCSSGADSSSDNTNGTGSTTTVAMTTRVDGVIYELPLGEDLYWCDRVAQNGHQVYVDPTVVVGHVKSNIVA